MQENLTAREQEILDLLLEGASSKEIGSKLNFSPRTAEYHRKNIYKKYGVRNYQEFIAKVSSIKNKQEELASTVSVQMGFAHSQTSKFSKLYKFLIPAAVLILFCLVIPLWYFLFKTEPSPVNIKEAPVFKDRIIDTVHLRTERYDDGVTMVQWYTSDNEIYLSDIFKGNVRDILPPAGSSEFFELRLSGTIDTELDKVEIHIALIKPDGKYVTLGVSSSRKRSKIGPGNFSEIFYISRNNLEDIAFIDQDKELSDCIIILKIINTFQAKINDIWYFDEGEIPNDVPNGTIMATIRNLKIEPVFVLEK